MNSINTQSKPMIGTKDRWGLSYLAWILVISAILLTKGCKTQEQDHLFIFKEAISWN